MRQYLDLMERVLAEGVEKRDRTGVGTRSIFGHQLRFDLTQGFPLVTTKKLHVKSIIYELLWFLRGDTNVKYLDEHGVTIWDEWADENGDLGPVYGRQWRSWPTPDGGAIDQMADVVAEIRRNPTLAPADRHRLESGGEPSDGAVAVPLPVSVQCRRRRAFLSALSALGRRLSRRAVQHRVLRAADADGGASDRAKTRRFIHSFGDAHLYLNHLEQARLQLSRQPRPLPTLRIDPAVKDLFAFRYEDFSLEGYEPHPHIKAAVAV